MKNENFHVWPFPNKKTKKIEEQSKILWKKSKKLHMKKKFFNEFWNKWKNYEKNKYLTKFVILKTCNIEKITNHCLATKSLANGHERQVPKKKQQKQLIKYLLFN